MRSPARRVNRIEEAVQSGGERLAHLTFLHMAYERSARASYLLIIVARVNATTKCKPLKSNTTPSLGVERGHVVHVNGVITNWPSKLAKKIMTQTLFCRDQLILTCCHTDPRADRLCAGVTQQSQATALLGRRAKSRTGRHPPPRRVQQNCWQRCSRSGRFVAEPLSMRGGSGSEQHRHDGGVRVADRIDAHPADHRGDRAVGFRFHPRRPVFQA